MVRTSITTAAACLLVLFGCSRAGEQKAESAAVPNEYPPIELRFVNGTALSAKELAGKNIFIFFQPDCDHCQEQAAQVEQRLDDFKEYTLFFVSSSSLEEIAAFAETYGLDSTRNVRFAWSSTEGVLAHYGAIQTPSTYIYADGRMAKSFSGLTDVDEIIEAISPE